MTITKNKRRKREYEIQRGKLPLGRIYFPSSFSQKAEGKIGSYPFEIRSVNWFGRKFDIFHGTHLRGCVNPVNWRGHYRIEVDWDMNDQPTPYVVRPKGFFSTTFELTREDTEELLFVIRPKFSWRSFCHDFELEYRAEMEEEREVELLLYAVQVIRLMKAQQAAAAS